MPLTTKDFLEIAKIVEKRIIENKKIVEQSKEYLSYTGQYIHNCREGRLKEDILTAKLLAKYFKACDYSFSEYSFLVACGVIE